MPRIKLFDACEHSVKVIKVDTSGSPWTITVQHRPPASEQVATLPIDGHSVDDWLAAVHAYETRSEE